MIYITDERFNIINNIKKSSDSKLNDMLSEINTLRDEPNNKIEEGQSLLDSDMYEISLKLDVLIEEYLEKSKVD